MINRLRGEAELVIAGRRRRVRYGWGGIAALQSRFGDDWDEKIAAAALRIDIPTIAEALAIGLQDEWPDVTPAALIAASPPIGKTTQAINAALQRAFHGDGDPPPNPQRLLGRLGAGIGSLFPRSWRPST